MAGLPNYDAFVIYNPYGGDQEFVEKMSSVLQTSPYNLRLCVPWTDQGQCDNYMSAEIIEKSCKKVIVVVSAEALQSDIFHFQLQVAHAISPGAREKRIIPVRLDATELPAVLRFRTSCDYYKRDLRVWIWDRIYAAFTNRMYTYPKTKTSFKENECPNERFPIVFTDDSSHKGECSWHSSFAFVS